MVSVAESSSGKLNSIHLRQAIDSELATVEDFSNINESLQSSHIAAHLSLRDSLD